MPHQPIRPEDILPEDINNTKINGTIVRKGTVAAFLANADILISAHASEEIKQSVIQTMKELAPGVVAVGLHKHAVFKNAIIEQIIIDASTRK